MNVLITTIGTRGDIQPYIALAIGLKAAGHQVTICTSPRYQAFVKQYNIGFAHLDDGLLALLDTSSGRAIIENLDSVFGILRAIFKVAKQLGPVHRQMVDDCWAATEAVNPDIIVYHPKMFCVPAFAAVRNIPITLAMLCPLHVPTGTSPLFGRSLGRHYNRGTYRLIHAVTNLGIGRYLRHWRAQHDKAGVSRNSSVTHISSEQPIPVMHACSKFVNPRPNDWPDNASITGYWFLPNETTTHSAWNPPIALTEFLEAGEAPVYFGFGSMAGSDPSKLTKIIINAVEHSGVRAVISTGWGGIEDIQTSSKIHVLESAPHEWLFPKMAAVVHHGGAGTTAAGLRAGCPTIICPYGLDQPFWGKRVAALGAGVAPIAQKKLTSALLADAIKSVTIDESFRIAAGNIANSIASEDGVAIAVRTIEQIASPPTN